MAKALVEVIGDSASAVRALEQTSAAFTATGDAAKGAAVDVDAFASSLAKAQATRAETLLAQAGALRQTAAWSATGSTEQMAANEAAVKRQSQAYKLLGVQAAATGQSVTKTAGDIGRGLTMYATVPAAFIGYESIKQALDFNQSLLLIRTQAGASQAELEHMNSAVLQLVQSGHSYGQTAQGMAQSLFYVESEGIRGSRALATIQAAAAGAAKGQTDMADTTNALTSAMKIWNVSADGAAKTMATIDAITATGKMHLQDLNDAFNTRFFSTAQAIGVPLEQAGALLDVFTKMGVPASSAATNLTTTFIRMVNPAKTAGSALQELGLNTNTLGRALQTGGITKALGELTAGYDHLVQTSGKAAAESAVFGAFGGSHGGGAALQAIKGYQSYMESLGQIQRLNNPATFWSQVSETMDQPAMKIKQDVAEIGADFIKLGTALAPTVATLASGVATISSAFSALPGPIKDAIGAIVAILAVGGPLGLAVSGLLKLRDGFKALGPSAAASSLEVKGSMASIDTSATEATTEVGVLRGSLAGLAEIGPIAIPVVIGLSMVPKNSAGQELLNHGSAGFLGHIPLLGHLAEQGAGLQSWIDRELGAGPASVGQHSNTAAALERRAREQQHDEAVYRASDRNRHPRPGDPGYHAPPASSFTLPQNLANELAKAQAGYGNINQVDERIRKYILNLLHHGRLTGKGIQEAYTELASVQNKAVSDAHKERAAFDQNVHNDTLLARARNDLAQGEVAAAQHLLVLDQQRLQAMLAEAKGAQERSTVLRQLAEVERLRHSKSSAFALSPELQMEVARADALAALNPKSYGPDSDQIRLAKQAKEAALRAIRSHTLTLQGLTEAWQIVGQENAILAQAKGAIDTYHAVSSKAIVDSVKGLSQVQQMQLRERIAQEEAHRGYAPNRAGSHHHYHHVHVTVHSNDSHIVKVSKRHDRQSSQRAGARR